MPAMTRKKLVKRKSTRKYKTQPPENKLITLPASIYKTLFKMLWLDRDANSVSVKKLTDSYATTFMLKDIMYQLGASDSLLNYKCIVICGPTGVGKTKFINRLKENFNVETINMDTMQVYSGISVGTGRTNLASTHGSHIYGVYSPTKEFHILDYLVDVISAVSTIKRNGNIPVFEGASKSMLDIIRRVFTNIAIFGIRAKSKKNIIDNITKRISTNFISNAIIELSDLLHHSPEIYSSSVLWDNWMVYKIIVSYFSKEQLLDKKLPTKITTIYKPLIEYITRISARENIRLHYQQLKRLTTINDILWFSNADSSIHKLESYFEKFMLDK